MIAFGCHLLSPVREKVISLPLGLASDTVEIQFQQETLVCDLVKGFREVQKDSVCLATIVNFTCKVFYFEVQLRFLRKPLAEAVSVVRCEYDSCCLFSSGGMRTSPSKFSSAGISDTAL